MATGNTANYNLPYPVPTDPVDVAGDIEELSNSLDAFLTAPAFINNISINGGSIVTSSATASIFNTGATTLNIGGAATVVNVGASAGQVNINGNFNIATGKVYEINDVTVISASALGSGIVSSSLTAVGTITTGTWNATTIAVDKGGTGLTSYDIGDIIYASASTTLAKLAGVATGNALISGGVGVAPSWGKIGLTTHVSGTLPVANGGTGITSLGTGIATWLGTPSSANLAAAVTDETGSGSLVFATSPTLSGTVSASDITMSGVLTTSNYINRVTGNGNSSWLQQDGTGRAHWYWNTLGGTSPTFTNAAEDASALTLHINNNGNGGSFFHRSVNGVSASAGGPISWTTTLYVDLNNITFKGVPLALTSGATFTGTIISPAATTSISSIRLPHGTAPTSPTNGDMWTTTSGLYAQINGTTIGPLGTGGGGGGTVDLQDILMFAGM